MRTLRLTKTEQERLYQATLASLEQKRVRGESIATRGAIIFDFMFGKQHVRNLGNIEQTLEIRRAIEFKREYRLMRDQLLRLKKNRYIAQEKTAEGLFLTLTATGEHQLLRNAIIQEKSELPHGRSCYVLFDIPESQKLARDAFRYFLKQADFKQVQLSVWKSSRNVIKPLRDFIKKAKIERWVTIIEGVER